MIRSKLLKQIDTNRCCICDNKVYFLKFCGPCYNEFKEDIETNKPWIRLLQADIQREARRRRKEQDFIRLDHVRRNSMLV